MLDQVNLYNFSNSTPVEMNGDSIAIMVGENLPSNIISDSVTLSGTIKRASNVEPPDQRYELIWDGKIAYYTYDSDSYEGDMEVMSKGRYDIIPVWGIELESPITLVLGEREITVTEMGVMSNQELKENQTYMLKGQIWDIYNAFYTGDFADCGYIGWEDVETESTKNYEDENENDNEILLFDYATCSYDLNNRLRTAYFSSTDTLGKFELNNIEYFPFGQFILNCDD